MKTKYINPTMEIIDVETEQYLLAGSALGLGDDYTDSDPVFAPEFDDDFDDE